jgi:hypothetical protein
LARRDFLSGSWPWRSLGYLLWTVPIAAIVAVPLGLLATPWLAAIVFDQHPVNRPVVAALLVLVGAVLLAAFGPLVALPLAKLERVRLKLIDPRPVGDPHLPLTVPGLWEWPRVRYGEAATWREVAYAILLVTLAPLLYLAVAAFTFVDLVFLVSRPRGIRGHPAQRWSRAARSSIRRWCVNCSTGTATRCAHCPLGSVRCSD